MTKLQNITLAAAQAVSTGIVLLLVSCSVDSFNGTIPTVEPVVEEPAAILIEGQGMNTVAATRAAGADAAVLLGGNFRVHATNDKGTVFNNYEVKWTGTPGTTTTDLAGWEYQGYMSKAATPALQSIKFWDLQAAQYDFVAFSGIADDEQVVNTSNNTFSVSAANMYTLYYANRVSARAMAQTAVPGVSPEYIAYGQNVKFTFRRATARIRVGFYETIPGYAVKDLRFYYDDNFTATAGTSTKTSAALEGLYPVSGKYTISYDADNVAHATYETDGRTTANSRQLGELEYFEAESTVPGLPYLMADGTAATTSEKAFLGNTSASASFAKSTETIDGTSVSNSVWHPILPYEDNTTPLKLKVDYTLVSLDGTKEKIHVKGAQVTVPEKYSKWLPNFSYTYLFKIGDTTSGTTGNPTGDAEGLFPITFDAIMIDAIDGMQTTEKEIRN